MDVLCTQREVEYTELHGEPPPCHMSCTAPGCKMSDHERLFTPVPSVALKIECERHPICKERDEACSHIKKANRLHAQGL